MPETGHHAKFRFPLRAYDLDKDYTWSRDFAAYVDFLGNGKRSRGIDKLKAARDEGVGIFLDPSTDPDTALDNLMSYQQPPNQLNDGNILVDSTELLLFHYKDGYVECLPFVMTNVGNPFTKNVPDAHFPMLYHTRAHPAWGVVMSYTYIPDSGIEEYVTDFLSDHGVLETKATETPAGLDDNSSDIPDDEELAISDTGDQPSFKKRKRTHPGGAC